MVCNTKANVDLAKHPAVRAWSELSQTRAVPEHIEDLKRRADSNVFRRVGVGPAGSNVIAKRCPKGGALAEQIIYREVLPLLPVTSLEHYGLWEEPPGEFCWVFIEDAEGVPYSAEDGAHSVLAADWLGRMHTVGENATRGLGLPCWRSDQYLGSLNAGRGRICQNLANPALSEADRAILLKIVTQFDIVERNWSWLQSLCAVLPWTFVHGDLHAKNLRVRVTRGRLTLVAFDWESAGRSVPAVDLALAGLDLPTYCSVVLPSWRDLEVENLVLVGNIFQLLSLVDWESKRLSQEWLHKPMKHMNHYLAEMARVIRAAELD